MTPDRFHSCFPYSFAARRRAQPAASRRARNETQYPPQEFAATGAHGCFQAAQFTLQTGRKSDSKDERRCMLGTRSLCDRSSEVPANRIRAPHRHGRCSYRSGVALFCRKVRTRLANRVAANGLRNGLRRAANMSGAIRAAMQAAMQAWIEATGNALNQRRNAAHRQHRHQHRQPRAPHASIIGGTYEKLEESKFFGAALSAPSTGLNLRPTRRAGALTGLRPNDRNQKNHAQCLQCLHALRREDSLRRR